MKINGQKHYLWRAVDHEGNVLECYVSKRRDKRKALKVLKKLLKNYGSPNQIVTDKLRSYSAALRNLGILNKHETAQYRNNQCENSHLHFRRRERAMNRFRSMGALQKFVAVHNLFNHQRHIESRQTFRNLRNQSLLDWQNLMAD